MNKILEVFTKEYKEETEYREIMKENMDKFKLGTDNQNDLLNYKSKLKIEEEKFCDYLGSCYLERKENMARLIDADAFKKYISNMPLTNASKEMFKNAIKAQPTSYDIDKVVEELKDLGSKYCINVFCEDECKDCEHGILMQKAIEIVKAGGKE